MNHFEYIIALEKMKALTTKKAKADFIREAKKGVSYWSPTTFLEIKLLIDIYNTITDITISGVKALPSILNNSIPRTEFSNEELEELIEIMPKIKCNVHNDYYAFMSSSGIPAHLKLAVLKAEQNVNI